MNNNGYTKIPNAIIRSNNLTVDEKLTWMFIASMPNGYQFTVAEACADLRINVKTWRRCVANLESAGLVVVDFNPGKKNVYRVLTPTTSDPGSQTVPLPNETHTPLPFETRGTHINKKDHLKNIVVADAHTHTRERLIAEANVDLRIEQGCRSLGVDPATYQELLDAVINDWEFTNVPDEEWTMFHLLQTMRIKNNIKKRENNGQAQNGNNRQPVAAGRADRASAIAATMAALGAAGTQTESLPY